MRHHTHRVLSNYRLTPPQWAILFNGSYYLPAPVDQFILEAQFESEENFTGDEIVTALDECLAKGWMCGADQSRVQEILSCECADCSFDHVDHGIVLTDAGLQLKEEVCQALLETVEFDEPVRMELQLAS